MTDEPTKPAEAADPPYDPWREPKPHPGFPPEVTAMIRFYVAAKGEALPECPVCQKRRRGRWTMLCPFRAFRMGQFVVEEAGEYPALTLVCSSHPISPTAAIMKAL